MKVVERLKKDVKEVSPTSAYALAYKSDLAKLLAAFEAVKAEVNLMRHAITLSESSLDEERENIAQKQRNSDAALRELEVE